MSIFNIFKRKLSPEELYEKEKNAELVEQIKRGSFRVSPRGGITRYGLSEYGALMMIKEDKTPEHMENVMTYEGELITWEEWLLRRVVE